METRIFLPTAQLACGLDVVPYRMECGPGNQGRPVNESVGCEPSVFLTSCAMRQAGNLGEPSGGFASTKHSARFSLLICATICAGSGAVRRRAPCGAAGSAGQREATRIALALRACVCAVPRGRGQGRERRTPLAFRVAFSRDIVGVMEKYFPGLV